MRLVFLGDFGSLVFGVKKTDGVFVNSAKRVADPSADLLSSFCSNGIGDVIDLSGLLVMHLGGIGLRPVGSRSLSGGSCALVP